MESVNLYSILLNMARNKSLSASLRKVANMWKNAGRKSDLMGTYNEQKRRAYNHYIESQTDYDGNGGVSTYNMTEWLKYKKALWQVKSLKNTIKKRK